MTHSPRFTPESAARRLAGLAAARANNPRNTKPWSSQDSSYAISRRAEGDTFEEIGAALERSCWSVRHHIEYQRAKLRPLPVATTVRTFKEAKPHPGVERCPRCLLSLPHDVCLARTTTEHVERFMVRPSQ